MTHDKSKTQDYTVLTRKTLQHSDDIHVTVCYRCERLDMNVSVFDIDVKDTRPYSINIPEILTPYSRNTLEILTPYM